MDSAWVAQLRQFSQQKYCYFTTKAVHLEYADGQCQAVCGNTYVVRLGGFVGLTVAWEKVCITQ